MGEEELGRVRWGRRIGCGGEEGKSLKGEFW